MCSSDLKRSNEIDKMASKQLDELQRVASMTVEEAKAELMAAVEKDSRNEMARIIRQVEQEARSEGEKKAREIIVTAIQRVASDQVAEVTTSTVNLPGEEMKGRIVGRNGRNIRAFEQAAGVDVIVDDTPEAVMISCFDPVRREIAKRALDRLILDGRIHPANIEKILRDEEKEVQKLIVEAGEEAAFQAGGYAQSRRGKVVYEEKKPLHFILRSRVPYRPCIVGIGAVGAGQFVLRLEQQTDIGGIAH